jgi:GNAT superfamily N-acetyltransferase
MTDDLRIVSPTRDDIPLILSLFRELAVYEKLEDIFIVDEATLTESLFGSKPSAEVRLAFKGDTPVGYMVFFENFSTFLGRAGIYLEDLFVKPEYRGSGYGKTLLSELARIAVSSGWFLTGTLRQLIFTRVFVPSRWMGGRPSGLAGMPCRVLRPSKARHHYYSMDQIRSCF